jgi:hypothetical protein
MPLVSDDPNVWSGRALQVDFAELAVSRLASMYPASDWSVLCSGPSWILATRPLLMQHDRAALIVAPTWNEFLPISMSITAIAVLSF